MKILNIIWEGSDYHKQGKIWLAKLLRFLWFWTVSQKFFHQYLFILHKLRKMALFKCFKRKAPQKFSCENFIGRNLWKFSPANLSPIYGKCMMVPLLLRVSSTRSMDNWASSNCATATNMRLLVPAPIVVIRLSLLNEGVASWGGGWLSIFGWTDESVTE